MHEYLCLTVCLYVSMRNENFVVERNEVPAQCKMEMPVSERDTDGPISSSGGRTVFTLDNTEFLCQANICLPCAVHFSSWIRRELFRGN